MNKLSVSTIFNLASSTFVGTILAIAYVVQGVLSRDSTGYDLVTFLSGFNLIAAIVLLYWYWLTRNQTNLHFKTVFFWAVVFRLIGVWGEPILEDDFYRYLLDACLSVTYGSPYGIAPETLFLSNDLSSQCNALLTGVNNPDLATIYAPLLQYIFLLSHLISPVNLDLLQFIVVLFDLAIIYMLGRLVPARVVLLYAWCPLVIKEFAFTAHPDVIGVCMLMAALLARKSGRTALGCILIAVACASKVPALAALPFFLYRQRLRYWILVASTVLIMYLPFLLNQQHTDIAVLEYFARTWLFNAPVFYFLAYLLTDPIARYLSASLFVLWYCYYFVRYQKSYSSNEIPRMDWIFGMMLILSPVLNAWYLVWVLPFAVIWPSLWAWTASVVIVLSYVIGLHMPESDLNAYRVSQYAQVAQVLCIGIALVIDCRAGRFAIANDR
ncbi:MAG: hypothetical protein OXI60_08375 [Acidiferrobacterales bacterium]|nr:hypothetical protein [Acidiferrobacterales bacterium]